MTTEERLEAMQKELNTWKRYTRWMLAVVVLVAGGSLVWGGLTVKPVQAEAGKEIKAERFIVVDEQGRERAILGVDPGIGPALTMSDAQRKLRAVLGVLPDGSPRLAMFDAQEELRAGLGVLPDGSPGLVMYDPQGETRAVLGVLPDGSPALEMLDAQGRTIWLAP